MEITITLDTKAMSSEFRKELACITDNNRALSVLAEDEDVEVRQAVAENPSTPTEILSKLATDKIWYVRENVAGNHNTSQEILSMLANDEDCDVRLAAVNNPNFKR